MSGRLDVRVACHVAHVVRLPFISYSLNSVLIPTRAEEILAITLKANRALVLNIPSSLVRLRALVAF